METEKKLFTVAEAAERLLLSKVSVYRHTKSGEIPAVRIGGKILITSDFIKAAESGKHYEQ